MKQLLIAILLMVSMISSGQKAIYIAFTPADYGIGIRGDYHFSTLGAYASLTYGNGGCYRQNDLQHHCKLSVGVLVPLRPIDENRFYFSTAINYHSLAKAKLYDMDVDPKIFNPFSFELGLTTYLHRLAVGVRTDILRWEACMDIGINF